MFWGYGKKNKIFELGDGKYIVANWTYLHIWLFSFAFNIQWHITEDQKIKGSIVPYKKIKEMYPINTPALGMWERYSIFIFFMLLIIAYLFN